MEKNIVSDSGMRVRIPHLVFQDQLDISNETPDTQGVVCDSRDQTSVDETLAEVWQDYLIFSEPYNVDASFMPEYDLLACGNRTSFDEGCDVGAVLQGSGIDCFQSSFRVDLGQRRNKRTSDGNRKWTKEDKDKLWHLYKNNLNFHRHIRWNEIKERFPGRSINAIKSCCSRMKKVRGDF